MRRAALLLAVTAPVLAGPAVVAFADPEPTTVSQPAPDASAEAAAAEIAGVLALGHTRAEAGANGSKAQANAVELGGEPLIDGTTGGSADGGEASGALLDTGQTPLGRLELTPWEAAARPGSAASEAALLRLNLIDDKTFYAALFQSESHADWTDARSTGRSSSDGAKVSAGDGGLEVLLLHSEASSDGKGSSYVLGINGNNIATSDDANGQCVIDASPLLELTCLTATGGDGTGTAAAEVLGVKLADGQLPEGTVSGVTTKGATGAQVMSARPPASVTDSGQVATADTATAGGLPMTGLDSGPLAALAGALIALGATLHRVVRRTS